jgi:hypothetical protein
MGNTICPGHLVAGHKKELPTIFYSEFIIICNIQIGGGNRCTQRKSLTCRKSMTNFIIYGWVSTPRHEQDSNSQL